MPCLRKP